MSQSMTGVHFSGIASFCTILPFCFDALAGRMSVWSLARFLRSLRHLKALMALFTSNLRMEGAGCLRTKLELAHSACGVSLIAMLVCKRVARVLSGKEWAILKKGIVFIVTETERRRYAFIGNHKLVWMLSFSVMTCGV